MDSQETALNVGPEEVKQPQEAEAAAEDVTVETTEDAPVAAEEDASEVATPEMEEATADEPAKKIYTSKKEIIERLKDIVASEEVPQKAEVEHLKSVFYRLHFADREAQQKEFLASGGTPETYVILPDEDEEVFKAEMSVIREKRQKAFQEQEAEKQQNLQKKLDIIEKIKAMITTPEEVNKVFPEFKSLQQEWKEIKAVPAERANELWRNYQLYVEQFYDLLNLNREAREYDFKKNLEAKTALCEQAERLADEEDVISAFHQLQDLHQQYRETGPVAKDLREEVWARFKAASTVINKRHQQHFEELRAREESNLQKKTALCEQAEAIIAEDNKNTTDWERHTQQIIELQKEWKTIGFAPQKMNVKIFDRFRTACDSFFTRKGEHFKELKASYADNADKKRALVQQAQALQDSTDWKVTADKLIELQKEWKAIGMVPKKLGDQLWTDFRAACNKFFDARTAANADAHAEEKANLEKKRNIIAQLKALTEEAEEGLQEKVQALSDEFAKVGHVPYREKEKIYQEYRALLDQLYKGIRGNASRRRMDNFRNNLKSVAERGAAAVDNERARLMRRYEQLKADIVTYENNLGFLSANSKKGNSLIDEMNRRIQKLKDDCEEVRQKIKAIDTAAKE